MINFHCIIIPVVVLDSVITHTNAWYLDGEIHQLVSHITHFDNIKLLLKAVVEASIICIMTAGSVQPNMP